MSKIPPALRAMTPQVMVHFHILGRSCIKELAAPCVPVADANCAVYSLKAQIVPELSGVVGLGVWYVGVKVVYNKVSQKIPIDLKAGLILL